MNPLQPNTQGTSRGGQSLNTNNPTTVLGGALTVSYFFLYTQRYLLMEGCQLMKRITHLEAAHISRQTTYVDSPPTSPVISAEATIEWRDV